MPLFFQQNVNNNTRLAIWKITEDESFFLQHVSLQVPIAHPGKRLQHLAGRFLLSVLSPGFPLHQIKISPARKPYLPQDQFKFSISHCSDLAAAIISQSHQVGIDAEIISPVLFKVKNRFLNATEQQFVASIEAQHQLTVLSLLWCAKEAVYKWYGLGAVDFRAMILTDPFIYRSNTDEVQITASFVKNNEITPLTMQGRIFNNTTAVWVTNLI